MSPEDWINQGNAVEALAAAESLVRSAADNASARFVLFEVLAVLGQWERARLHLAVAAEQSERYAAAASVLGALTQAEPARADVFAGKSMPAFFGAPAEWMGQLAEVSRLMLSAETIEVATARQVVASASAPPVVGRALLERPGTEPDNAWTPFSSFRDSDERLGPMLEAFINGRYLWLPFSSVVRIEARRPSAIHHLVWCQAIFTLLNGAVAVGFIPVRYPGFESADADVLLARTTRWSEPAKGFRLGIGQKVFITDSLEVPLLDVRQIEFNAVQNDALPSGE